LDAVGTGEPAGKGAHASQDRYVWSISKMLKYELCHHKS